MGVYLSPMTTLPTPVTESDGSVFTHGNLDALQIAQVLTYFHGIKITLKQVEAVLNHRHNEPNYGQFPSYDEYESASYRHHLALDKFKHGHLIDNFLVFGFGRQYSAVDVACDMDRELEFGCGATRKPDIVNAMHPRVFHPPYAKWVSKIITAYVWG